MGLESITGWGEPMFEMERIILVIPEQEFCFLENGDVDVDSDSITCKFSEPYTGTLFFVAGIVDGDDDAVEVFGVPDGETTGHIAFSKAAHDITDAWKKVLAVKQKLLKED